MTNDDKGVFGALTEAVSGVPEPVKKSFFKSISTLLGGLTSIPAAWLHQKAQSVEDRTAATSLVAQALAKAVAEKCSEDPSLIQAAAEVYLPEAIRKAENRVRIAKAAADQIASNADSAVPKSDVDQDWLNTFSRFAEDASSERLQDLFGRILAGEVRQPGAFSASTLRAVSELSQEIAQDFSSVWELSVGEAVDYSEEFDRGSGYSRWMRLAEAGLMAPTTSVQYLPPFNPVFQGFSAWSPFRAEDISILILFSIDSKSSWKNIQFTRVGREIATILPPPNYEQNFRRAADRINKSGINQIHIMRTNKDTELIWRA
ncbi:DUF2806 domain-containing protein [Tabrizicola sp.]|uniref:DUF2806 domain-containing protein n=1 Tax=Tabrizicola sp. TaxID=2005166 RepID=UPI0025E704EB|nr:DUF2806 domain-containing protein [Tabrizicola sp.]